MSAGRPARAGFEASGDTGSAGCSAGTATLGSAAAGSSTAEAEHEARGPASEVSGVSTALTSAHLLLGGWDSSGTRRRPRYRLDILRVSAWLQIALRHDALPSGEMVALAMVVETSSDTFMLGKALQGPAVFLAFVTGMHA